MPTISPPRPRTSSARLPRTTFPVRPLSPPRTLFFATTLLLLQPWSSPHLAAQIPEYVPGPLIDGVAGGIGIPSLPGMGQGYNIIDAADMNLDGHLDLLLAAPLMQEIFIFHGSGNGNFAQATGISMPGEVLSVHAADFNEDGRPDIVSCDGIAGTVSIRRSNPNGPGYLAPYSSITGSRPVRAYSSDIDEDGHLDLIVVDEIDSTVGLLRGTGYGTFLPPQTSFVEVDDSLESLTIADLDGDGHKDLVIPCPLQDLVAVLLGIGNGSFLPVQVYPVGVNPGPLSVADHDGDGNADVIVPNRDSSSVSWLRGDGTGGLAPAQSVSVQFPPVVAHSFRSAPGFQDHVAIPVEYSPEIAILANFTPGGSPQTGVISAVFPPEHLISGDFDEDGFNDLVAVSPLFSMIQVFLQVPNQFTKFRRGDIDRDGNLDLLDGVLLIEQVIAVGEPVCADRCDANDDGRLDLADPIFLLQAIFDVSQVIPSPHVSCGFDPTPDGLLDCLDDCTN